MLSTVSCAELMAEANKKDWSCPPPRPTPSFAQYCKALCAKQLQRRERFAGHAGHLATHTIDWQCKRGMPEAQSAACAFALLILPPFNPCRSHRLLLGIQQVTLAQETSGSQLGAY